MPITLTPHKKHVIPYVDEKDPENSFSITWQFPISTLSEGDEIRRRFQDTSTADVNRDKIFAASIKEQTGFVNEKGETLVVQDPEGTVAPEAGYTEAEINRAAIYDYVKLKPEYIINVMIAYLGPRSKNLLAGVTLPSTGSGVSTDVPNASEEKVA